MTIKNFKYLFSIIGSEPVESIVDERVIFLISYFSGIKLEELEKYNLKKYNKLFLKYRKHFNYQPKNTPTKWFYYNKNVWVKRKLSDLTFGDFVDLYKFTQQPFSGRNLDFIILKCYKPIFDLEEIPSFENLKIDNVYFSIQEIIKFVSEKLEKYKTLFKSDKKDENVQKAKSKKKDIWQMLNIVFDLCNDDPLKISEINKMNIDSVFIYLIWKKQKNEEMQREMEKAKLKK